MAAVGVDHQVQKINGKWLIIDSAAVDRRSLSP